MKNGHIKTEGGTDKWHLHGKRHRTDGPAVIGADGSEFWYLHGKLHREDGPAAIGHKGAKLWYLYGKELTEEEFRQVTNASDEELPMYLGRGYDEYIQKRLKSGGHKE